jgi:hypothetical protein
MDWALCEVLPDRTGANQHRYQLDVETGKVDFCAGDVEGFGAGQPCQATGPVEADDKVHFVGQTTGLRRGVINAAQTLISCNKVKTLEWTIIPVIEEQENLKGYSGASGASIIRDRDNKLVGHLWARGRCGLLVFTPIDHVFRDIKLKLRARNVRLAPAQSSRRSPLSTLAIGDAENEAEEICRDKEEETPVRKTYRISSMQLPKPKRTPPLPNPKLAADNASLPSPVTTAAASRDTFRAEESLQSIRSPPPTLTLLSILRSPSWPQEHSFLANNTWTVKADKSKLSLSYILHDSPQRSEKRSTPQGHKQPVLQRSSNTWPPTKPRLQNKCINLKARSAIIVN